jgi:hypothetical protein
MLIFVTAELQIRQDGICNAEKSTDIFNISGMMMWRITNAYIHDCRIANSAGRKNMSASSVLPNLQFGRHEYAPLQCAAASHRI